MFHSTNTSSLSFSYGNNNINSKIESKSVFDSSSTTIKSGLYFKFFDHTTVNLVEKVKRSLYINNFANLLLGQLDLNPDSDLHSGTSTINTL